mgnify:CR=1 FL=1
MTEEYKEGKKLVCNQLSDLLKCQGLYRKLCCICQIVQVYDQFFVSFFRCVVSFINFVVKTCIRSLVGAQNCSEKQKNVTKYESVSCTGMLCKPSIIV